MDYEWDPDKAQKNLRKHHISFADAVTIFSDENAITIEDEFPGEERFVTIGMDALGRLLVVVYTFREDIIRVISARRATSREQQQYEE